jgi:hypothetical protein
MNCETIAKFYKTLYDILRAFDISGKKFFPSMPLNDPFTIILKNDSSEVKISTSKLTDIKTFSNYTDRHIIEYYRVLHPELPPKDIRKEYNAFKKTKYKQIIPNDLRKTLIVL